MLIGIDLLWVRPKICGGTESVIRNLMTGFGMYDDKNEYLLFVGRDVADTFKEYEKYSNMHLHICETDSMKRVKRIAWENANLDKVARGENVDVMLIPVYSKPKSLDMNKGGIPYVTVIHDLQALHYPEYFSKAKLFFAKRSWKRACEESAKVITISEYCKDDIIKNYPVADGKCVVIYDPIIVSEKKENDSELKESECKLENETFNKYKIEKDKYFYTVSSMLPHKNLGTLVKTMKELKGDEEFSNIKLVVSGVGGNKDEFNQSVKDAGVEDMVIDTGFVSNEERDILYENCKLFLFPSIFEGFGMPPIEAMMKGARVVTTRCSCLQEVTKNLATYVDEPKDSKDWVIKIKEAVKKDRIKHPFDCYNLKTITEQYIELLNGIKTK